MRFKEDFLRELRRRLKENMDLIESSFKLSRIDFSKTKMLEVEPVEYHLSMLIEEDPYMFLGRLAFLIINKQNVIVRRTNIACDLLLELTNLVLEEFGLERIASYGR